MNTLKVSLEALPSRLHTLPVDARGYPVPWFVAWLDGKPDFRVMDGKKFVRAIREKRCWVCGDRLGKYMTFASGCMCGINRTSPEPPSHQECAAWSARNCPFLSNPHMVRREDDTINNQSFRESAAGFAIMRNPGVTMLWTTRHYECFPDGRGGVLIQMGEPEHVEWWREGRRATRAEILCSIDGGLPNLEALARVEKGGLEALACAKERFFKLLPAASADEEEAR
jgi:hypothetical protein